jgi:hypothetical protein
MPNDTHHFKFRNYNLTSKVKLDIGAIVRIKTIAILFLSLMLTSCVAPALMLSPQSQLLWALLKPMVGLDPNESNFFEQPMIKSRLQPLLGEHYDTAVTLLGTATELQQQGPMFFLVSKHSPLPNVAEKAGFVWNSDTNQMAVLLVSGGAPTVFAEQVKQEGAKVIPQWPDELAEYTDPAKLREKALAKTAAAVTAQLPVAGKTKEFTENAIQSGDVKASLNKQLSTEKQKAIEELKAPIKAPIDTAKQQVNSQFEAKKANIEVKTKNNLKQLVGKDEPTVSEENELAAELNAESSQLRQAQINTTPAQLEKIKQAEIRLEQAQVLLTAAETKEKTASNKTEAKLLVLAAKDQLRKAEQELANAKIAAGQN